MNKIFKVIWNHTTQTWIAVSELGKSKTKSKSRIDKRINIGLVTLGAVSLSGNVIGAEVATTSAAAGATEIPIVSGNPDSPVYIETTDKKILIGKTATHANADDQNTSSSTHGRSSNIISIGFDSKVQGQHSLAIGSAAVASPSQTDGDKATTWGEAVAIGYKANALAHQAIAIGANATANGAATLAIGAGAKVVGIQGTAVGHSAQTQGHYDIAIGRAARTSNVDKNGELVSERQSAYNLAIGDAAYAQGGFSIAIGRSAKSVHQANAIGWGANANGTQSVAVGTQSRAINANSAAFGYKATAQGWGDIALGLEAKATPTKGSGSIAIGQSARAFGDKSGAIGAGTVVGGDTTIADSGLGSFAVGARNNITGIGTFVLGYGVTVNTNSSVVLGDSSSQTGSHIVENVTSATVTGISYSGFAGKVRDEGRFVSIGAPDSNGRVNQRKIINMAAGKIESNSTEAINGSQLYLTHKAINDVNNNIPFDYTHKDDDKPLVRLGDKYYKEEDIANLTYDPNTNTFKDNNGRTVTPKAVPENKVNITVKGEPKTVENIAGNLAPTYNKGDLKEGGTDDKPNGQLTDNTSPVYTQRATKPSPEEIKKIYNNAATVGDVLNSGWNLSLNGDSQIDFVKPYDTVNFANGKGTLASVETKDGKVSNVTFNIDNGEAKALESGALQGTSPEEKADLKDKADKAKEAADKAQKAVETKETELTKAKEELAKTPDDQAAKDKVTAAETALAEAKAEKANKDSLKAKADRDLLAVDNKVATVENVVSAVNKSGFTIYQDEATDSNKKALVNPGDKVVYKAAGEARVNVSKEKDGTTNITYSVDVPVIYTDEAGNKLIKGEDGKFYPKDALKGKELIDGKYYPEGSVKVGDKIYPAGSVVSGDKAYPAGTELKDDGTPKDPNVAALTEDNVVTPVEPQPGNVIASMNSFATDPKTGKETTATVPMGLSNVAAGANTYAADKGSDDKTPLVKVGDNYYKPTDFEKGKLKANATPTDYNAATSLNNPAAEAREGLADLDHSNPTNALTVADAKNLGWIVSSDKKTSQLDSPYADDVRNANEVRFVGKGLATVSGETITEGEGESEEKVRVITVDVNAQTVAEKAQLPVVYTDKDGNKLVKGKDGKFYKPEEIADKVFIDGKYYPADSVKANDGKVYPKSKVGEDGNVIQTNGNNPNEAIAVEPYTTSDVIASMNNGENNTITPMSLSNVQGNLPQTVNKGDRKEDPTLKVLTDGKADTATKSAFAPNNIGDIYNNAATVGDVLNSGWNLKNNGEAKDFVKPYDTVNFIDTKTVSAKVETNESGLISNVSFSVNTGEAKVEKNGKVVNSVKETDKTEKEADVAKKAEALKTTKTDLTTAEATRDEKKTAFDTAKANYDKEQESLKKEKEALAANPSDPLAVGKVKVAEIALKQKADELEKAKKALEEAENAVDEKQALVDAAQGALDKAKTARAQLDNQVATVKNVVDAINGSGFNIFQDDATEGNHKALVNPGDKVVYAAEGLATVTVDKETDAGVTKITYKVDAQAVAETAQLPVVYTDKDGNKLVKGKDGEFYKPEEIEDKVFIDGKYYPADSVKASDNKIYPKDKVDKDGNLITTPGTDAPTALDAIKPKTKKGDVIASMNNAAGSTTNPMALTNIASNLNPADKVVLNPAGAPQQNPFTDGTKAPELSDALKDATSPLRNNAATIGDVLNAGWNLQGNGEAKDFVRHTDTVNFVNGVGTTVSVTTDADKKVSEVRVNSLIGLTDENGTPVIKGADNKFYKVDANGQPDKTQPVEAGDLVANVINPAAPAPNEKGDPLQLGNIAAGAKTFDNEVGGNLDSDPVTLANDGKWYPADQVEANGKPKENAAAIPAPKGDNNIKAGLIDFNNSNPNNALTVEDARNLGWIVSTSENQYADQVRNANKVNFKGKDGISVTGETNADGVREITIALKKGEVISSNGEKPKTKDNNTPLTKVGDQYFKTTDVEGGVVKVGDSYYKADDVETKDGVTKPKDNVTALTPITSDNVTSGDAGAGFVTGNQVGDAIQASGFTVGKSTTATLPTTFDNKDEKVNPDDNLRFADGKGIKVSLGTVKAVDNDGVIKTTTTVKVDIDNAKLENNTDGSVKDIADPTKLKALRDAEKKVADAKQAVKDANQAVEDAKKAKADAAQAVIDAEKALTDNQDPAKADELQKALDAAKEKAKDPKLDTAIKEAKDAAAKPELADAVKAAEAELAKNPTANQVATAQNVADAINNSGFTLKASAVENKGKLETGTADKTKGELINPGKTVEMIAGKNMSVKHDKNGQITYATKDDVNFDSVQFGDNGPKIQRDGDNIKVSNSTGGPTKITNVAPGTADTDAVNVKQLKEAVGNINNNFGDINNRVNKLDKRMRGIGANVAAAASLPQVYIPGKSMISAAAGGYNGASAVAVGYSRASDNGKLILKLTGTANSTGQYSGGVGVGYQW